MTMNPPNADQFLCCILDTALQLEHPPFIVDGNAVYMFLPHVDPTQVNESVLSVALSNTCGYHRLTPPKEFMRRINRAIKKADSAQAEVNSVNVDEPDACRELDASVPYGDGLAQLSVSEFVTSAYRVRNLYRHKYPAGTTGLSVECYFRRNERNRLPAGIYLHRRGTDVPVRVFVQTNVKFSTESPTMSIPLYPGSMMMSCIVVILRDINVDCPFATFSGAFYSEYYSLGVFTETPRLHTLEGVQMRTHRRCLLDRRWRGGSTLADTLERCPKVCETQCFVWPSVITTAELEANVIRVATGMLDPSMLDANVTCKVLDNNVELRYVLRLCDDSIDDTFSGFFPVTAHKAATLKVLIGANKDMVGYPRALFSVSTLSDDYKNPRDVTIYVEGKDAGYCIDDKDRQHFIKQAVLYLPQDIAQLALAHMCVFVSCNGHCAYLYMAAFTKGTHSEMFFC